MTSCKHTDWLRLWKKSDNVGLEITDRPRRLLEDMRNPDQVSPFLLVLLGNQSKRLALTKLRIGNARLCSRRGHGETHLFISSARGYEEKPIIVADGDIPVHNRLPSSCRNPSCHEILTRTLPRELSDKGAVEAADEVFHRSLMTLADVICIFCEDVGGMESSIKRFNAWLDKGQASISPLRPRLLLVVEKDKEKRARQTLKETLRTRHTQGTASYSEDVSILVLPEKSSRATRRNEISTVTWDMFRQKLFTSLELSRQSRRRLNFLFSARHFVEFLQYGAHRIVKTPWGPFDFIQASRKYNKIAPDLATHIINFVGLFDSKDEVRNIAIPLLASSFILDHYTPGMHDFNPRVLFQSAYKGPCNSLRQSLIISDDKTRGLLTADFVSLVEDETVEQFEKYRQIGTSIAAHKSQIARYQPALENVSSEKTCLYCIRRRPQTGLQCLHSICHVCAGAFYGQHGSDNRLVHIDRCLLCTKSMHDVFIRKQPPTATARVLSFDGGGVRGITEIESLVELQIRIALPYPVIQHFDICFATSCGAGIMLRLCDGWDVQSCRAYFKNCALRAFEPRALQRQLTRISWLRRLWLACSLILTDSKYPSRNLDTLLEEQYGTTRSIMDYSKADAMGIKYGITLTTVGNSDTLVATNYNGIGQNRESTDYTILRPTKGLRKIPLWEIMRCAIAAPFYFTTKHIDGVGTFQDGGLTFFNNPASIAVAEARATKGEPSIVVSLGTGSSQLYSGGSFLDRLKAAFYTLTDSRLKWKQLLSHQNADGRGEFFRFDIEFQGLAPPLDDVEKMEEVSEIARETIAQSPALDELASHLRAELFFFELDDSKLPRFSNGSFSCLGHISCRLEIGTAELEAFMQQLQKASASFQLAGRTLPISFHDRIGGKSWGEIRQAIHFRVPSRQAPFDIVLDEGRGAPCNISGSPFTLEGLIRTQNLEAYFGTADHRKRTFSDHHALPGRKRRRLR